MKTIQLVSDVPDNYLFISRDIDVWDAFNLIGKPWLKDSYFSLFVLPGAPDTDIPFKEVYGLPGIVPYNDVQVTKLYPV